MKLEEAEDTWIREKENSDGSGYDDDEQVRKYSPVPNDFL